MGQNMTKSHSQIWPNVCLSEEVVEMEPQTWWKSEEMLCQKWANVCFSEEVVKILCQIWANVCVRGAHMGAG